MQPRIKKRIPTKSAMHTCRRCRSGFESTAKDFKDVEDGYLSREKWRSWHEQLSAVAEMKGDVKYDSETIELAGQACVVMDEAERSGSGRDHGNHQSDRTRRVL